MSVLTKPDIVRALVGGTKHPTGWRTPDPTMTITVDGKAQTPKDLHIGPNSIDLHLHQDLKVYQSATEDPDRDLGGMFDRYDETSDWPLIMKSAYDRVPLDARKENPTFPQTIGEGGYVLVPGVLYLGRTVERTHTPHHVPKIGGRSSTGRLGINIHQTAGFGDVGFDGTWTLELSVIHPVRVYPNMRIAQLWLFEISSALDEGELYQGRYQGQVDPTGYRGHER